MARAKLWLVQGAAHQDPFRFDPDSYSAAALVFSLSTRSGS